MKTTSSRKGAKTRSFLGKTVQRTVAQNHPNDLKGSLASIEEIEGEF